MAGSSGTMSRTAALREDLVIAALEYVDHVFKTNGFPGHSGHFSKSGKALGAAAVAYRKAMEVDDVKAIQSQ